MMINAGSDINGSDASGININPAAREISGWSIGGYFCQSNAATAAATCGRFISTRCLTIRSRLAALGATRR